MALRHWGLIMALSTAPALAGSAEDDVRAALTRVETLNPRINAVLAIDPSAIDQARSLDRSRKARGPLHGVPMLIKDNIEMKGSLPTTAGSLALLDNVSNRDAPLVASLRAAGAIIIGKTNLSEWANIRGRPSISGWSAVGGQVRNPHALNRSPCGSSSGSGAAVAAGIVDAAIGTETDGSITCPASVNGIVGLKPTVGLVSRSRIVPISHSQDTAGPMTRDVRTAALVLGAIAGSDPADPATAAADAHRMDYSAGLIPTALQGQRIGVMRFAAGFSAPVDALFEAALQVLVAQGAILVEVEAPKDRDKIGEAEHQVLISELKADLNAYLAATPSAVEVRTLAAAIAFNKATPRELSLFNQATFEAAEATRGLSDPVYLEARASSLRRAGAEGIDAMLAAGNVAALVAPTTGPAWLIDVVNGDRSGAGGAGYLAAVAGTPHLTVPMGAVQGLPVGLSFMGSAWSEARLLALGYAYEQASKMRVTPSFAAAVDDLPSVKPLLEPGRR